MYVITVLTFIVTMALAGCVRPGTAGTPVKEGADASGAEARATPKRIVAAMMGNPRVLSNVVNSAGGGGQPPGLDTLQPLIAAGMVTIDHGGQLHAQLAAEVPSVENGLWKVFPDARMETLWKIRPGAAWHDGVPLMSQDLVFAATLGQDRELAIFRDAIFDSIDAIEARDSETLSVLWKRPYIDADMLFSYGTATATVPLPEHLLGQAYAGDKAGFTLLPYWSREFVGTGPFKLRELEAGSHVILDANEGYPLGRPKLDQIEVRFIPDSNTLLSNVLAGVVELTLGRNVSLAQGLELRSRWDGGQVKTASAALWMGIYPQFLNPDPPAVADLRFRRALLHAVDRPQMVETIQAGLGTVAETLLIPDFPEYRDVAKNVPRYEYDVRRTANLLGEMGLSKGPDGMLRNSEGRRISVELRTVKEAANEEALYPVADYWQAVGVEVEPIVIPPQRISDRPYRATFPGFEILGQPDDLRALTRLRAGQTPLPETSFAGSNRVRYMNPDFEGMLDRYFTTIPKRERAAALGQVLYHVADQLVWIGLYHQVSPALIGNRLVNVGPPSGGATQAWNAHEWDLTT